MSRTANQLRADYLKFFAAAGHTVVPSSSLIPAGDPSLLFTSAGMVPFKAYFLGLKKDLSRTASSQKCFRTTDIDRVGTTVRHLTFFEMLGNFSFGDYFKAEAIAWAWTFLTKEAGLDAKRLHVSVFKDDDEAEGLWKKHKPANPIVRLGEDANFWNMGPTGPCGPCSEIYFDRGAEHSCGKPTCAVGCDCDRYLEVWNLVFTQFDRQSDGSLKPLPRTNIDTGMGLERLTMVAQGKRSPFETDLFWPIMETAAGLVGKMPGESAETKLAFRVIGDHTRAAVFLASEGIVPSNEGRGYVLRRLIRRALRYGRLHGRKDAFVHLLVPDVLKVFKGVYNEPAQHRKAIEDVIRTEEERFLETLETGERLLSDLLERHVRSLPGEEAFKLYDTYGFPLELTREICSQRGIAVDESVFEKARVAAQVTARAGWKGSGEKGVTQYEAFSDKLKPTLFLGYDTLESQAVVIGLLDAQGKPADALSGKGQRFEVILDRTPFYAEGGGQVGDRGSLLGPGGEPAASILDTQSPVPGVTVHKAELLGKIKLGQELTARVDPLHRTPTACHHTATHLLNEALRRKLGVGVRQAGSLVAPDHLRFDYTAPKAPDAELLHDIEEMVNGAISQDLQVQPQVRTLEEASQLKAVMLPGEKYGDQPRCVMISPKGWDTPDPQARFSLELCGGTHVHRTGEIRLFKVLRDSSISAGTRRIEAVAGPAALRYFERIEQRTKHLAKLMSAPAERLEERLEQLLREVKELRGEVGSLKHKLLSGDGGGKARKQGTGKSGVPFVLEFFPADAGVDMGFLRNKADAVRKELPSGLICEAGARDGKVSFVVSVSEDLRSKGLDAVKVAKLIALKLGGSGGGRPDFAQGGGKEQPGWQDAVEQLLAAV